MKTTSRNLESGFTLTELLIVVVIIAILASVATPAYMGIRNSKARSAAKIERNYSQDQETDVGPGGYAPIIERFEMDWDLESDYQRVGLEVYSRYQLSGEGEIEFRASDFRNHLTLHVPFPKGTIEASNVSLLFIEPGREPFEPNEAVYRQSGIYWSGTLQENQVVKAKIAYSALGTESMELELPRASRIANVALSLDLDKTPADSITSFSLNPTATDGNTWQWKYKNLVSNRKITVLIPGTESPSGRLILLFRFIALAVLLFGAGFLYMSESRDPDSLSQFRLGHFFLLALTYSLFFVVFSVIVYREMFEVRIALMIAAVSSFPLLVMHVARIIDLGFAIKHILPLAAMTIAVVVNGVYGGALRDVLFLGMLVLVSAYLTVTYRPRDSKNLQAAESLP